LKVKLVSQLEQKRERMYDESMLYCDGKEVSIGFTLCATR
jgi:hypothetical protein